MVSLRLTLAGVMVAALLVAGIWLYRAGHGAGVRVGEARAQAAEARAAQAGAEVLALKQSVRRTAEAVKRGRAAEDVVTRLTPDLNDLETADATLDPDRSRLLRRSDRELCALAPQLAGCGAAGRHAP